MEIKGNAGIAPAYIPQEVTRTGTESVANGVSQATPAGIAAAKAAFEKAPILGNLPDQIIYSGIVA